jgi:hypothetical protein
METIWSVPWRSFRRLQYSDFSHRSQQGSLIASTKSPEQMEVLFGGWVASVPILTSNRPPNLPISTMLAGLMKRSKIR